MRPTRFLVVACGGAAGAAARWGVTETLGANTGGFDWTLVAVNTVGSFLLGLVMFAASDARREHGGAAVKDPDRSLVMVAASDGRRELLRLGLGVGFCGELHHVLIVRGGCR